MKRKFQNYLYDYSCNFLILWYNKAKWVILTKVWPFDNRRYLPMAENKYITQTQENGSVLISEEVLVNIISVAVAEVEGAQLSGKPGINWGKGIKLTIDEQNRVAVKCYINVSFNQSVVAIAAAVQENVAAALESMAGVTVLGVNVSVVGVIRQ